MYTNKIKFIYEKNSSSSGNSPPISATIIIILFIVIIVYFYYNIILKDISYEWDNKKCTPKYIFYSGFLVSKTGDPIKDTYNNFKECTDPTKNYTNTGNNFKIVFDTADNITNTANYILDMSRNIISETDRIKLESQRKYSSIEAETNIIQTSINQLYNYQLKLYIIIKMYFERIFIILDTFSKYITDIKLFKLSNMKYSLSFNETQLTSFINNINEEYRNIYSSEIENAVIKLNNIKRESGYLYQNADYQEVNDLINSAKNKYIILTRRLKDFDAQNRDKILEIDELCQELTDENIKYTSIFPHLQEKILNPDDFITNDIV